MSELSDIQIQQQIYLEQLKNGQDDSFDGTLEALSAILALYLAKAGVDTLAELTKKQLSALIAKINEATISALKLGEKSAISLFKKFLSVELNVTSLNIRRVTRKPIEKPPVGKTWKEIRNQVVPGIGLQPAPMLRSFLASILDSVGKTIRQGYAEKLTISQLLQQFTGTKAKLFKDGLLNKYKNQFQAVNHTIIQFIASWVNQQVSRQFFEEYEWISILDSRTTVICQERNGKLYRYGEGPIPPAHYRCRSRTVAVIVDDPIPTETFYSWINRQPRLFQNDALGRSRAADLRSGKIDASDLQSFSTNRKLTFGQYAAKQNGS